MFCLFCIWIWLQNLFCMWPWTYSVCSIARHLNCIVFYGDILINLLNQLSPYCYLLYKTNAHWLCYGRLVLLNFCVWACVCSVCFQYLLVELKDSSKILQARKEIFKNWTFFSWFFSVSKCVFVLLVHTFGAAVAWHAALDKTVGQTRDRSGNSGGKQEWSDIYSAVKRKGVNHYAAQKSRRMRNVCKGFRWKG